jgi:branched-chain amino acid transport system ATP-binding protein
MADAVLEIHDLNAHYGTSHVLQDVSFVVDGRPVAVIGRNGMGKSTMCAAIMGMLSAVHGSVRFRGEELLGRPSYKIAKAGIGFVPQGRRLFGSLTVDEHLRIVPRGRGGDWSAERVYESFPRLSDLRRQGAGLLSGGEQQMLAIGRALLNNPRLLVMDEPSEGLAPKLVDELIDMIDRLVAGGMGLLLVEQNMRVATSLAERQLVMVAGRIATETTAETLANDPEAQRRYLGVQTAVDAA